MVDRVMEPLLKKAKELEKKYEWLQATESYQKAADLALKQKDYLKAAELQERLGFCFYRAAFQAQTGVEFRKLVKLAAQTYEKEIKILEENTQENSLVKIKQAKAFAAYAQSWYEADPRKKKELLEEWWVLEHQVLEAYENIGDQYSVGRTCTDLAILYNQDMFWLEPLSPKVGERREELWNLLEKAIQIFSKLDDNYELAGAYCTATWYNAWGEWESKSAEEIIEINKKCQAYSKKALELSKKTGDAWLLNQAYSFTSSASEHSHMNHEITLEYGKKALEYAKITKDKIRIGMEYSKLSWYYLSLASSLEDPDKQKESFEKAIEMVQNSSEQYGSINRTLGIWSCHASEGEALAGLAAIESDSKAKQILLGKAVHKIKNAIEHLKQSGYEIVSGTYLISLSDSLRTLSTTQTDKKEKRKLLQEALSQNKKHIAFLEVSAPNQLLALSRSHYCLALVYDELAKIVTSQSEKGKLLKDAAVALEKCVRLIAEKRAYMKSGWAVGLYFGQYYSKLGEVLKKLYSFTKEEKRLNKAIEAYKQATLDYEKAEMPTHVAESYWNLAQLNAKSSKHQEAAENYESAASAYNRSAKRIPQLKQFYEDYASYMRAWSQIEQAKYSHSIGEYEEARQHYEKAASLHETSSPWSYLAPNYLAWANMEEAESLSRREKTQQAKQTFQEAYGQFCKAEESIKQKIEEGAPIDEQEMIKRLLKASNLRREYCKARILLEDAKLLDREGKHLQSSKGYEEAAKNISAIVKKTGVEAERKELELLAILCQAWERMAKAEETASSESYLEAATLFGKAKELCFTKKASYWASGNSSFCKGLAAGTRYQDSMDLRENASAKRYIKNAASSYLQAGFKNAAEYAKATQRLFDAYAFMNQAESEAEPEKKAKRLQMAENLLQMSAGSFLKAKQPEKTSQVQQLLKTVREEKALAVSLTEVMHAPTITSSTLSFTAPTPTNEASVGLESFEHANVQANLIAAVKKVKVGESFCLTMEFVNAGKEPALLTRVEEFIPQDFIVVKKPEIYRLEENCLNMKGKQLAPLKLVEAKLVLQPSKKGLYHLKPKVNYLDEMGRNRRLEVKLLEIKVEEIVLADRVSTGTKELDSLLLGGIPNEYAVALTGPPSDEREMIIKNFLESGIKNEQVTFYIASEAEGLERLLEESDFYLFLCNPKPKVELPDLPNIYKLGSKTDLTNLSIALSKAYRKIEQPNKKRLCTETASDILLDYGAKATRKWISELITDMGSKGFTILVVMDPSMHAVEERNAVLNLFDGEISISQGEDSDECRKSIRVKKLRNQDYIRNPICLTK